MSYNTNSNSKLYALLGLGALGAGLAYLYYRRSVADRATDSQTIKPGALKEEEKPAAPPKASPTASSSSPSRPQPPREVDLWFQISENDALVHELLVQGEEFLQSWGLGPGGSEDAEPNPFTSVAKQVRSVAEQALWDSLGEGLSADPPQTGRLLALILDSRAMLLSMVPENTQSKEGQAVRASLEGLEADYVEQRLSLSPFDFEYLRQVLGLLVDAIKALESPHQAEQTQAKFQRLLEGGLDSACPSPARVSGNGEEEAPPARPELNIAASEAAQARMLPEARLVVRCTRFVFDRITNLQEDIARARLQMLSHAIAGPGSAQGGGSGGAEYERRRLTRLLHAAAQAKHPEAQDPVSLSPLSELMPRAFRGMREAWGLIAAAEGAPTEERAQVRACLAVLLASLVSMPTALRGPDCPEPLALDARRIVGLQDALQKLALVACAILIAGQVLASRQLALTPALAALIRERFLAIVSDPFVHISALKAELHFIVAEHCAAQGKPLEGGPGSKVVDLMMEKVLQGDSPVFKKVNGALGASLRHIMAGMAGVNLPAPSSSSASSAAASPSSSPQRPNGSPADVPRQILKAIGVDNLLLDVQLVAESTAKIVGASVAVAEPFYTGLLRQIRAGGASS